jgi:hypothetical protein
MSIAISPPAKKLDGLEAARFDGYALGFGQFSCSMG